MPQDSLRSAVYRSFVTCDDPKGVVECSAIRRSKSKGKDKDYKTKGSSSTSTFCDEERMDRAPKESTEELQNLSSFQIREVSKGAQKLNDVIDSWSSNTGSFDRHSKFIAKDLLKGALHLQESLVMLGKLQETSQLMAKPKKQHKKGTELLDANGFGDNVRATVSRKSGISTSQSSRDCYDELREAIRESFARQNLLPKVSANENELHGRKSLDLRADFQDFSSTSSSHSSLFRGRSSDSSPSNVGCEKPKGSNLIAKLMGLEEVPIKASGSVAYKQLLTEKLPNQRSYLIDIDLARPRKPQFAVQKVLRERRTLEEIIETMQFKGLLGRNAHGSHHGKDFSDIFVLREHPALEDTPIVIMKPRQVPDVRPKEFQVNYDEEKIICNRQMPRKRTVEEFPLSAFNVPRAERKLIGTNDKLPAGMTPKRKHKGNEARLSEGSPARLVQKTLDSQNSLSSMKMSHRSTSPTKVQKKEELVKKIDVDMKVDPKRKHAGTKDDKIQEAAKSQDSGKTNTLKLSKSARGSNAAKVQVTRGEKIDTEKNTKPKSPKAGSPKKNLQKSKPNSIALKTSVEYIQSDDTLPTNLVNQVPELLPTTTSEKTIREVTSAPYDPIHDNSGYVSSSSSESSQPTINDSAKHIENSICSLHPGPPEIEGWKSKTNTRRLLLSSKSFLNCAKELFNTRPYDPMHSPTTELLDTETLNDASVLLKCAEEILVRKSMHHAINLLSRNLTNPRSLEQLLVEISEEIEELRKYMKSSCKLLLSERIHIMLERDLIAKRGAVICNWDLGWSKNCFTVEEVNGVVEEVEELVFDEILDDAITLLML